MKKVLLMTPGPTCVPDEVRLAEAQPIIHHRTKEFQEILGRVAANLKPIFKTQNMVLIFASSGTGAMEGAVVNTLSRGDKVIVIRGGKFGERWAEICTAYGVEVIPVDVEWGDVASPDTIKQLLDKNPDVKAVLTTLCETSTTTLFPVQEYGEIIKNRPDTLFIVDAISGLGACDIQVDNWGVDICVSGSQKAIMLPPGLAFASVSEKAWKFAETSNLPKFYFNFKKHRKSLEKSDSAYTPAVSLIVALDIALKMLNEEGIDGVLKRHAMLGEATREAAKALGLRLLSKYSANVATGIWAPQGVDGAELKKLLSKKYSIEVAGGQDHLKGKIIRIAHLGWVVPFDIIATVTALELALKDLGYNFELCKGVKAAEEVIAKG